MNRSDKILKRLRAGDLLHNDHPWRHAYSWHGYAKEIDATPSRRLHQVRRPCR